VRQVIPRAVHLYARAGAEGGDPIVLADDDSLMDARGARVLAALQSVQVRAAGLGEG
jgi:hypothetical protein